MVQFLFGVLRIPLPQFNFRNIRLYRPLPTGPQDPRSVADRWIRSLEDETGCISISTAFNRQTGAASGTDAGPSALHSRFGDNGDSMEARKYIPDFMRSSYEEALRRAQKDIRIACIILVSDEHQDVSEFKK